MWEMLLRRDGLVFAGGLLLVAGLSWVWLLMGAGMPMMSEGMAGGAHGRMMQPAVWSPGYAMLMFSMWWVMMVAMMLPSAAPVLLIYMRIARKSQEKADALAPAAVFAAGYLVAWGGFSVVATGAPC
jgi:predicted metal-binding membrane protein